MRLIFVLTIVIRSIQSHAYCHKFVMRARAKQKKPHFELTVLFEEGLRYFRKCSSRVGPEAFWWFVSNLVVIGGMKIEFFFVCLLFHNLASSIGANYNLL